MTLTESLPFPGGGYWARCTCGWSDKGPHQTRDEIAKVVEAHVLGHRSTKGTRARPVPAGQPSAGGQGEGQSEASWTPPESARSMTLTEPLPLPAGGFGARCTCGWFETGPHQKPDDINLIIKEHAEIHRAANGGLRNVVVADDGADHG